jgi:hypothetical protein
MSLCHVLRISRRLIFKLHIISAQGSRLHARTTPNYMWVQLTTICVEIQSICARNFISICGRPPWDCPSVAMFKMSAFPSHVLVNFNRSLHEFLWVVPRMIAFYLQIQAGLDPMACTGALGWIFSQVHVVETGTCAGNSHPSRGMSVSGTSFCALYFGQLMNAWPDSQALF